MTLGGYRDNVFEGPNKTCNSEMDFTNLCRNVYVFGNL